MFSPKVVFMTERKPAGLSASQRADLWCRWKAGQSLHEIGRALGKEHAVIHFLLARHGELLRLSVAARVWRSHWRSEKTSLGGSRAAGRFVKPPNVWIALRPR